LAEAISAVPQVPQTRTSQVSGDPVC